MTDVLLDIIWSKTNRRQLSLFHYLDASSEFRLDDENGDIGVRAFAGVSHRVSDTFLWNAYL